MKTFISERGRSGGWLGRGDQRHAQRLLGVRLHKGCISDQLVHRGMHGGCSAGNGASGCGSRGTRGCRGSTVVPRMHARVRRWFPGMARATDCAVPVPACAARGVDFYRGRGRARGWGVDAQGWGWGWRGREVEARQISWRGREVEARGSSTLGARRRLGMGLRRLGTGVGVQGREWRLQGRAVGSAGMADAGLGCGVGGNGVWVGGDGGVFL
jgi:hypothetical protein